MEEKRVDVKMIRCKQSMYLIMRTAKKKAFSASRKHSKYKVTNWSEYNESLRKRGNIEFMIASDLSAVW